MGPIDLVLFRWVNRWPDALEPLMLLLSEGNKWLGVRVFLLVVFVALVWQRTTRPAAILAMLAWPLSNALTDALKVAWQWPRPSAPIAALVDQGATLVAAQAAHPDVVVRVAPLGSFGTASAHSANMMAVAAVFLLLTKGWLRWAWLAVAVLTGLSRVYVGVHYPSQVLFGWACGAVTALVLVKTWEAWVRLRSPRPAPDVPPGAAG